MNSPISKTEARRRRKALLAQQADPAALAPELSAKLERYRPRASEDEWAAIEVVFREVMTRSEITSARTFKDNLSHLGLYLLDTHRSGRPLTVGHTMTFLSVDTYAAALACPSERSRTSIRSSLRSLARRVNAGPDAPPKSPSIPYQGVRPPYTPDEVAKIVHIALTQPSATVGRQLRAVVGLGLGAGLDSGDLRSMRGRDIEDRGDAGGITVRVTTGAVRRVVVRREYEDLVRRGVAGLDPADLVTGRLEARKHVGSRVVDAATVLSGKAPHIEMSRLRSTWLTWLLGCPVPLPLIMAASGLRSARTLTDLLAYLDAADNDPESATRDGEANR